MRRPLASPCESEPPAAPPLQSQFARAARRPPCTHEHRSGAMPLGRPPPGRPKPGESRLRTRIALPEPLALRVSACACHAAWDFEWAESCCVAGLALSASTRVLPHGCVGGGARAWQSRSSPSQYLHRAPHGEGAARTRHRPSWAAQGRLGTLGRQCPKPRLQVRPAPLEGAAARPRAAPMTTRKCCARWAGPPSTRPRSALGLPQLQAARARFPG